jgi:hypothetical protein
MANTVTLSASAKDYSGKQFVARIAGRDNKYTFQREFLGRKEGKSVYVEVDEPGLYQERDVDSKGRVTDYYYIVYVVDGQASKARIEEDRAMAFAREIEAGTVDFRQTGLEAQVDAQMARIREMEEKNDPEGLVPLHFGIGSLEAGSTVTRAQLIAERRKIMAEAQRHLSDGAKSADPRREAITQIRALMARHHITLEEVTNGTN